MLREIDLQEISDGKLYTANDMVKIGSSDCRGCSECCRVVDDTIQLDPYDIYQLEVATGSSFEQLLTERISLSVVDGLITPHLTIRENHQGCTFLSEEGRCQIHGYRPGFCRMFPMGRIYDEEGNFKYFLQVHECSYPDKTKIKLKKWLGIEALPRYEQYVKDWHAFQKGVQKMALETENEEVRKSLNMHVLNQFYVRSYDGEDFYGQFYERLTESRQVFPM